MLLILNWLLDIAFEKLTEIIWDSGCDLSLERIDICFLLVARDTSNPRTFCLNQGLSVLKLRFSPCECWSICSSFLLLKYNPFKIQNWNVGGFPGHSTQQALKSKFCPFILARLLKTLVSFSTASSETRRYLQGKSGLKWQAHLFGFRSFSIS